MTAARPYALLLLAIGVLGTSSCGTPTSADLPKDPGTVVVRVFDTAGTPIEGVQVSVTQPNHVGGFFSEAAWTDANGTRSFPFVAAGQRPVEVTLPSGYAAGSEGTVQNAAVVKGKTMTVTFHLVRLSAAAMFR